MCSKHYWELLFGGLGALAIIAFLVGMVTDVSSKWTNGAVCVCVLSMICVGAYKLGTDE